MRILLGWRVYLKFLQCYVILSSCFSVRASENVLETNIIKDSILHDDHSKWLSTDRLSLLASQKIASLVLHKNPIIKFIISKLEVPSVTLKDEMLSGSSVIFNNQGDKLLFWTKDSTIKLLSAHDGSSIHEFSSNNLADTSPMKRAAFSKQADILLTMHGNYIKLWNTDTGEYQATLEHIRDVDFAAFNKDGNRLVSATYNQNSWLTLLGFFPYHVSLWDTKNGNCLCTVGYTFPDQPLFNKRGDKLLTHSGATFTLRNTTDATVIKTVTLPSTIECACHNNKRDEILLIYVNNNQIFIVCFDLVASNTNPKYTHARQVNPTTSHSRCILNKPGDRLVIIKGQNVLIFDTVNEMSMMSLELFFSASEFAIGGFTPEGSKLIVTSLSGENCYIIDIRNGQLAYALHELNPRLKFFAHGPKWKPLGILEPLFTNQRNTILNETAQAVQLICESNGQSITTMVPDRKIDAVRSNKQGTKVATISNTDDPRFNTVQLWDLQNRVGVDLKSLVEGENFFSLPQAFILARIYEVIVQRANSYRARSTFEAVKRFLSFGQQDPVFDFNTCRHLQPHYETLNSQIRKILDPYVWKVSATSDHAVSSSESS